MICPVKSETECLGPAGERWWVCPVHGARLTPSWTRLCRTHEGYRQRWLDGRGPGQEGRPNDPAEKQKPRCYNIEEWIDACFARHEAFNRYTIRVTREEVELRLDLCVECDQWNERHCKKLPGCGAVRALGQRLVGAAGRKCTRWDQGLHAAQAWVKT
jgi:hypothetical protein